MGNEVFNLIQEQKRRERFRPIAITRNLIIGLGAVGALGFMLSGIFNRETPADNTPAAGAPGAPVVLNTAAPPIAPVVRLTKPASIEQPFGRTLLTGVQVEAVPRDPLESVDIDRRWDGGGLPVVYKPPADLPASPASDAINDAPLRDKERPPEVSDSEFGDLPEDARKRVATAKELYQKARAIMTSVERGHPQWSQKMGEAADTLKRARDELSEALKIAPESRALIDFMQEVKFDLYACNKHRLK
jgi:hypothetical protein